VAESVSLLSFWRVILPEVRILLIPSQHDDRVAMVGGCKPLEFLFAGSNPAHATSSYDETVNMLR
jgi:hypothetical protein